MEKELDTVDGEKVDKKAVGAKTTVVLVGTRRVWKNAKEEVGQSKSVFALASAHM